MRHLRKIRRRWDRLTQAFQTVGFLGTISMSLSYLRWRLKSAFSVGTISPNYKAWWRAYRPLRPASTHPVSFSVICPVHNTKPGMLRACISSVRSQTWKDWELLLVDDASTDAGTQATLRDMARLDSRIRVLNLEENLGVAGATNAGAAEASGDYLVFLDHDDLLVVSALEWLASVAPNADLVYTDEDKIDDHGVLREPFFKPAWSPRLLLGVNYVNHITCIRKSLFDEVGGLRRGLDGVQDHDLLLRIAERRPIVAHIPHVLYHWRAWSGSVAGRPSSKVDVEDTGLRMIAETIDRRGWDAHATLGRGSPFSYRVLWDPQPDQPLVKIVLPTRDRLRLLRKAVAGVLERTDSVPFHLVVVDNGSRKASTISYLDELRERDEVTVHRLDDAFNFSRLCNIGVDVGPSAPYTLFLNNDIEVLHRDWLLQLSGWLRDPDVLAVGPKLLFPNKTIQHAGVIVGFGGIAGHYSAYEPDEPRLGNLHDQVREVSCLTAACLLVRTDDYQKVGGMNESLPVDFQDVDLCLRLKAELGGELIYDPTYPLVHLQSASRGLEGAVSGYTVSRMEFLWGEELSRPDPYYSPHLSMTQHDFSLARIPGARHKRLARLIPRFGSSGSAGRGASLDFD